MKPGKGAAFVRTKLKNLLSNSNQEKTFRGGETVGLADVQRREAQFTYVDGEEVRGGGSCKDLQWRWRYWTAEFEQ